MSLPRGRCDCVSTSVYSDTGSFYCQICATLNSKFIIREKLRMTLRGDVVCINRGECMVELVASDKGDQLSQVWWEIHCQRVHGHE